ncbi:hypothetical protein KIPB_003762 [Kipferlia bialata]|uniref:Uncharacterized protein n=1 Tax=Kipferlia bialata TaxID=797122 RepID=A0A9K3CUK7_9EUKA|nr:hypothetical protein KIPB_003762 [Kipferlia bialata]|eukprot:g3762.t1
MGSDHLMHVPPPPHPSLEAEFLEPSRFIRRFWCTALLFAGGMALAMMAVFSLIGYRCYSSDETGPFPRTLSAPLPLDLSVALSVSGLISITDAYSLPSITEGTGVVDTLHLGDTSASIYREIFQVGKADVRECGHNPADDEDDQACNDGIVCADGKCTTYVSVFAPTSFLNVDCDVANYYLSPSVPASVSHSLSDDDTDTHSVTLNDVTLSVPVVDLPASLSLDVSHTVMGDANIFSSASIGYVSVANAHFQGLLSIITASMVCVDGVTLMGRATVTGSSTADHYVGIDATIDVAPDAATSGTLNVYNGGDTTVVLRASSAEGTGVAVEDDTPLLKATIGPDPMKELVVCLDRVVMEGRSVNAESVWDKGIVSLHAYDLVAQTDVPLESAAVVSDDTSDNVGRFCVPGSGSDTCAQASVDSEGNTEASVGIMNRGPVNIILLLGMHEDGAGSVPPECVLVQPDPDTLNALLVR